MKSPDESLRCLLIQPAFPRASFWNYRAAVAAMGARTPEIPLGLITIAAILPQQWQFRLIDLNCRAMTEADWAWADLIGVGGMLPQQLGTVAVIREARRRGTFVVVGGSDPTSQPEVYREADARVLDEGEISVPLWLASWRAGTPRGIFRAPDKPNLTTSPVPRYDLLRINDYGQLALQISRGCPFNCEFCDIIELYGRKPRIKSPAQVVAELEAIYRVGYGGIVNVVDDNFIGNKRYIRREILPAVRRWNAARRHPFTFATEASMNIADDAALMSDMVAAGFGFLFTGIETPDPELLMMTQKSQNTMRPIQDRLRLMLAAGLVPTAGFIMGFDNEKSGTDKAMIDCIEGGPVSLAMVGLLVALPNTQLTRRLQREGRLLDFSSQGIASGDAVQTIGDNSISSYEISDQTIGGLNFVTTRDRAEIFAEFENVIRAIYAPKAYMDRVLRQVRLLRNSRKRRSRPWAMRRELRGLIVISWRMTRDPALRWLYWRNFGLSLVLGAGPFDFAMRLMGLFLHLSSQRDYILKRTKSAVRVDTPPVGGESDAGEKSA